MMTIDRETTPAAWVGCLGCYNAGRLVGEWVDGLECDAIPSTLATTGTYPGGSTFPQCRRCGGDEWWVFDHEGYLGALRGECSPAEAYRLAAELDGIPAGERGAFAVYVEYHGGDLEYARETFEDAYAGEHASERAYAEHLADECGWYDALERAGVNPGYFDAEAYARDLFSGDYHAEAVPGDPCAVYVFRAI